MSSDEFVDLFFRYSVQVLELVQSGEFDDVETVGCNHVRFDSEKVFGFVTGDIRYGGESMSEMRSRPFHAVSVIYLPLTRLVIYIELEKNSIPLV